MSCKNICHKGRNDDTREEESVVVIVEKGEFWRNRQFKSVEEFFF